MVNSKHFGWNVDQEMGAVRVWAKLTNAIDEALIH